jgi:hypothetical protein
MTFPNCIPLLLALFVIAPSLHAQNQASMERFGSDHPLASQPRGTNMISCSEYETITYNGLTIAQIEATDGEASQVQQLWGNYTSVETMDIVAIAKYYYNGNRISFRESELTGISIQEPNWPITILGKNINVGDTFTELQQRFGNNLKIIHKPDIDSNYAVSFGRSGNDGDGLLVNLSPETNKVVEITYFVNP